MDLFLIRLKQRVPLNDLHFGDVPLPLDEAKQDQILSTLEEISKTNGYYSVSVVKKLIDLFEGCGTMEVNEAFYELLMEHLHCQPLKPTDTDIITYTFRNGLEVKVRESPNLISGLGTTGLRTWEASLYLAEYLMDPTVLSSVVNNTDVLELGCGTGMVSVSMMKHAQLPAGSTFFITDGDSQLVERVRDNIALNFPTPPRNYDIRRLWWGEDDIPDSVKTIVAADVTYDASIIPDLVNVLNEGIAQGNVSTALIAATKRNEDTLAVWEHWLDMGQSDGIWSWEVASVLRPADISATSSLYYGHAPTDILIYRLSRATGDVDDNNDDGFPRRTNNK